MTGTTAAQPDAGCASCYPQVFINAGGLLLGFVLVALLLIGLDRWRATTRSL